MLIYANRSGWLHSRDLTSHCQMSSQFFNVVIVSSTELTSVYGEMNSSWFSRFMCHSATLIAGNLLWWEKHDGFPQNQRSPFHVVFYSVAHILVAWAHFQTWSCSLALPADVVNTHSLMFHSPCKYTQANTFKQIYAVSDQWEWKNDGRSDSFFHFKNLLL